MSTPAGDVTITRIDVTPVGFTDPPLLNSVGVHEPVALRAVVRLTTDAGISGLGETYGDEAHVQRLRAAADQVVGLDVFALHEIRRVVAETLAGVRVGDRHGLTGSITASGTIDRVFGSFEVACLDVQGKALGRPVSDLLGGAVRDRVPFSGYLFYKWAGHPGQPDDAFGPALDPAGIVEQARWMLQDYGFTALKLKGGVFPPAEEAAAIEALRAEFPTVPLRLDPNACWSPATSIAIGRRLGGVLEYLEDPARGIDGMAETAADVPMPLATNMCVVDFEHIPEAVAKGAVQVILSDHHYWGGLQRSRRLAGICDTFGLGLSMHSNSHLGISLAAMVHLAAATPELTYACDTHWPWKSPLEDVIERGALAFSDGSVAVPTGPGLGITLDEDALARRHEQYVQSGLAARDDTGYMRRFHPGWDPPQW
jgi:glucarate dehydratase